MHQSLFWRWTRSGKDGWLVGYLCTESFTPVGPSAGCSKGRSLAALPAHLLCLGQSPRLGIHKQHRLPLGRPVGKVISERIFMSFQSGVDGIEEPASNLRRDFLNFQKFYYLLSIFSQKLLLSAVCVPGALPSSVTFQARKDRLPWYCWR